MQAICQFKNNNLDENGNGPIYSFFISAVNDIFNDIMNGIISVKENNGNSTVLSSNRIIDDITKDVITRVESILKEFKPMVYFIYISIEVTPN